MGFVGGESLTEIRRRVDPRGAASSGSGKPVASQPFSTSSTGSTAPSRPDHPVRLPALLSPTLAPGVTVQLEPVSAAAPESDTTATVRRRIMTSPSVLFERIVHIDPYRTIDPWRKQTLL